MHACHLHIHERDLLGWLVDLRAGGVWQLDLMDGCHLLYVTESGRKERSFAVVS